MQRDRARFNSCGDVSLRHGARDRSHEVAFVGTLRTNVRIHSTDPTVWWFDNNDVHDGVVEKGKSKWRYEEGRNKEPEEGIRRDCQ